MNSIYLLVPLSLVLVGIAVWGFFWAVDRGQFEDLEDGAQAALEEDRFDEACDDLGAMRTADDGTASVSAASTPPRG